MDGQIVSDDMIRVRIDDEPLRMYVIGFLLSDNAQRQMLKNEYGTIQQHLEPSHVSRLLIPIPDQWEAVSDIICWARKFVAAKEKSDSAMTHLDERGFDFLVAN